MDGVEGRAHFVKFAVGGEGEDLALFRQRQAQMYAGYHRTVAWMTPNFRVDGFTTPRSKWSKAISVVPSNFRLSSVR
jgi:hypothetical protein